MTATLTLTVTADRATTTYTNLSPADLVRLWRLVLLTKARATAGRD